VLGQHFFDIDVGDDRTILLQRADIDLIGPVRGIDRAQLLARDQLDGIADGRVVGDATLEFWTITVENFAQQVDAGSGNIIVRRRQVLAGKRPTVARISEIGVWLFAKSPTRARDPRTEITRPRDVTLVPGSSRVGSGPHYVQGLWKNG